MYSAVKIGVATALAGFLAGFTVSYIATEGDVKASLWAGAASAAMSLAVATGVLAAGLLTSIVGFGIFGMGAFASPIFISFIYGSAVTGYFIWDTGNAFKVAETEAEVLALEVQLSFLVVGWGVSLGYTSVNSRINGIVRGQYKATNRAIKGLNKQWISEGVPLSVRAYRAWSIRHAALVKARNAMFNSVEVKALEARNVLKYGNKDGLFSWAKTLEYYKSKGFQGNQLHEEIIAGSQKTNQAVDAASGN